MTNLPQSSFTLSEDGTPQAVRSFEEHVATPAVLHARPLQPGEFTNAIEAPTGAVNVILLDFINTPLLDQPYLRQQLVDFARKQKPGNNVAIFALTTKLVMLQAFTTDPAVLQTAIANLHNQTTPLRQQGDATAPAASDALLREISGLDPAMMAAALRSIGLLKNMEREADSAQTIRRGTITLEALNILARYLSNVPGRKNLIWMSGSFPLNIQPYTASLQSGPVAPQNIFSGTASLESEYRETVDLLARARVAVYPVDARSLQVSPAFTPENNKGRTYAHPPSDQGKDLAAAEAAHIDEDITMTAMATDSGGQAFLNTNALGASVARVIDQASNYYTLSYIPSNKDDQKDLRRIQIKLAGKGYQISYRRAYNVSHPHVAGSPVDIAKPNLTAGGMDRDLIMKMMAYGVPNVTEVPYELRLAPSGNETPADKLDANNVANIPGFAPARPPFRHLAVSYRVPAEGVSFPTSGDGRRHPRMEFLTLVYMPDGKLVNSCVVGFSAALSEEQYANMQQRGITIYQDISVPEQGEYIIRTGVHDLTNNRIGAIEVPAASVLHLPKATF